MKLNGYPVRKPRQLRCCLARPATTTTLGFITARPGISGRLKAEQLRRLTLSLLAFTLLAGTMAVGPSVRARQEPAKQISFQSVNTQNGVAFGRNLMTAPTVPGTSFTVQGQATVDAKTLYQEVPQNIDAISVGATNTRAISNDVLISEDGRKALAPADTTLPDPTVVLLPTPIGLQSSSDIPDFSLGASDQFILNANSLTIYFQDNASNVLGTSTLAAFFSNVGVNNPFGPMVTYDDLTNRWIIAALDNFGTSQSSLLLGVSHTSDPTTTWSLYKLATDSTGQTSAGALSSIGGNSSFLVLSTAQFQNAQPNPFQQSFVFEFDKNALINNNTLSGNKFTDSAYLPCPAQVYDTQFPFVDILTDLNGNSSGHGVIRHGLIGTNAGQVQYAPSAESLTFGSTWAIFPPRINFLPQQGSSTGIDGGDGRIANAVMRNNMLFATHSVYQPATSPDHQAIHWLTENLVTGATQDGFFQGGGSTSYFKPSLAVTPTGGLLIAFNSCSPSSFPSSGFLFRYEGQQDFLPYTPIVAGTGPSVALKNGINVGPTTSAASRIPRMSDNPIDQFIFHHTLVEGSAGPLIRAVQLAYADPRFGLSGTISADNGAAAGFVGPPQGSPLGQFIFGNMFPSSLVGGSTLSGMQFFVPSISGSIQQGQQVYLYYGLVPSTLNGAPLTMQPITVGQQNQFQTFTFPQPIQVPAGQSFYAGVSGPGGQYCLGVDTNVPIFWTSYSSPNGLTAFSADPVNFMVRVNKTPPPCTSKLDKTERAFSADGKKVCIAHGKANCKPTAISDVDWVVFDDMGFLPDTMEFNVLYHVLPNTSRDPRIGEIKVNGEVFTVLQAGNNTLAPINATPNSAPAGGSGVKVKITPPGRSNSSGLTPRAAGFTPTTTIAWDGEERPTTFVSATEIDADIPASDLTTQGTVQVSIFDLAPGGGTSPSITFTITAPGPDFSLSLDQSTLTGQAGAKVVVPITINRSGGFTGSVTVTPPAPQAGIKPKPADPISTTDTSVRFKLKIGGSTPAGTYQLVFKGVDSSGRERDVTLTLVVSS